jgi:cytochrome subunit of sulfide dehydrogenase
MKIKTLASLALSVTCLGVGPLTLSSPAQAQNAAGQQALYAASLAATCANCHGTEGRAVPGSRVPSLAGLDSAYFVAQLNAFKSGARPATVMQQIGKGFNDAQIEALARYFAAQKK